MKVLFDHQIFRSQKYGGVSRYHIELKKSLEKFGCKVDIPVKGSINEYLFQEYGIEKSKRPGKWKNRFLHLVNNFLTIKQIRKNKYDIIHPTWYDSYLFKRRYNTVVTIHDMIHEIYFPCSSREIRNKKKAIYKSKKIIAISQSTKNDILRFYPDINPEKIVVIYHGTNHLPKPKKPSFDLPHRYILFVGRRANYKNGTFLLNAFAPLVRKDPTLYLLFAGGGKFTDLEKETINSLQIDENVIQADVCDSELAYLYQNAKCCVYPSLYEGFGYPVLESFDNNCPLIVCNSSSLPEVAGDAALYFEKENVVSLTEKISALVYDEKIRQIYIAKGKERVKEFTWDKTGEETFNVYSSLLDGGNRE